jgi:hypothetical protein
MTPWVGGFRCGRCSEQRAMRQRALRSPRRPALAICTDCVETWQRMGHRCARCWTAVRDRLEVGVLVETGAFAHVACGGARVLGSPVTGLIDPSPHCT